MQQLVLILLLHRLLLMLQRLLMLQQLLLLSLFLLQLLLPVLLPCNVVFLLLHYMLHLFLLSYQDVFL